MPSDSSEPKLPEWMDKDVVKDLAALTLQIKTEEEALAFWRSVVSERELFYIACRIRAAGLLYSGFNTVKARALCTKEPNISRGVFSRVNQEIVRGQYGKVCKDLFQRLRGSKGTDRHE